MPTETTDVGFVRREVDGFPICLKCNRPVDEWGRTKLAPLRRRTTCQPRVTGAASTRVESLYVPDLVG